MNRYEILCLPLMVSLLVSCGDKKLTKADAERQIREALRPAVCEITLISSCNTNQQYGKHWLSCLTGLHNSGYIFMYTSSSSNAPQFKQYSIEVLSKLVPYLSKDEYATSNVITIDVGSYNPEIVMITEPAPDEGVIACNVEFTKSIVLNEVGKAMGPSYDDVMAHILSVGMPQRREKIKTARFIKTQDGWMLEKKSGEFKKQS